MNTIKIKRMISDNTIRIDELQQFKGKIVNIIIFPDHTNNVSSISEKKIPNWVGKYSGEGKITDDRTNIYR
jgi:hypothetical protein